MVLRILLIALALMVPLQSPVGAVSLDPVAPRIEEEVKLAVDQNEEKDVWDYLETVASNDSSLSAFGDALTASVAEELFTDVYFDTPELSLLQRGYGIRHRYRDTISHVDDPKDERELIQVKMNTLVGNRIQRAEMKYDVSRQNNAVAARAPATLLQLMDPDDQADLSAHLTLLGVDIRRLRPVLTLQDRRRRVYIAEDGEPLITISLDRASSKKWWNSISFTEVEFELNEVAFTAAAEEERDRMRAVNARLVADIRREFPDLTLDPSPKYNKTIGLFAKRIPLFLLAIRAALYAGA